MLLNIEQIRCFLLTEEYKNYKVEKFGIFDELDITKNPVFQLLKQGEINKFSSFELNS